MNSFSLHKVRKHGATVVRTINQALFSLTPLVGRQRPQKSKLPEDPRIFSMRNGLSESDILGFTSVQIPVELLSSLGSDTACLILISFS